MPHDSKGREIVEGDCIAAKAWWKGNKLAPFIVVGVIPSSDTCNVNAVPAQGILVPATSFTAKEVEILLKADGSKPADPASS